MASTTTQWLARDGVRLRVRRWPLAADPRASVLIVHGLGEHSGRYEHVGDAFAAAGLATRSYDHRGFGASEGCRAYVERWAAFHDDLEDQLAGLRAETQDRPLVLYGHSLGALIALGYVLMDRPRPDLLVLTAPAFIDDLARWKHLAAPLFNRIVPRLMLPNGVRRADVAAVPRPGLTYENDPLVQTTSSVRLGTLGFDEQKRVRRVLGRLEAMPVPTLVARGDDDPIVPARALTELARLGNVTARSWPGMRHEIHNEAAGTAVIADVVDWILAYVSAAAATPMGSAV